MGTTAQKLEYLGTTKSQLKDMINYGLDDDNKITSSTTFRNYVGSVFKAFLESLNNPSTLFNNLPKITGTGSNITLNDTANAPMRIELGASELTQDGTPTPSSPQDIHTISGSNTIKVEGKNLFDKDNANQLNSFWNSDKIVIDSQNNAKSIYIKCEPNTTYTISKNAGKTFRVATTNITPANNVSTISSTANHTATSITITTEVNANYLWVNYFNTNNGDTGNYLDMMNSIMIEKGSTPTTYEPYISQEANIDLSSKNLISVPEYYPVTAGPVVLDLQTPVPAGTYTISIKEFINGGTTKGLIHFLDSSNTQLTYTALDNTTKSATITVSSPIAKLRLYSQNSAGASTGITSTYVGLMLSTSGGEYQEYYEPLEYCKIGTYEDKFIRTSGKNLFDKDNANVVTGYGDGTGNVVLGGTSKITRAYIPIEPNINMNISGFPNIILFFYNKDKTFIERVLTGTNSYTFNKNAYYIRIQGTGDNFNADAIMLNEGTTALPYEPYGSNEWYIKKNIGKVVLDGTENWGNDGQSRGYTTNFIDYHPSNAFCNIAVYEPTTTTWTAIGKFGFNVSGICWFRLDTTQTDFSNVTNWKNWLATNNAIICFVVNNPEYIPITGTLKEQLEYVYQLLKSYKGVTNISQVNNDLAFELDVEAVEDME